MNGTITAAHQLQQARYQQRIAREGLLAALAPYRAHRSIPTQRQTSEPGPTRP